MKKLYSFLIIAIFSLSTARGQITYPVNVVNNEFQPDSITITQGDGISFECSEGFHNVDGSLTTYPDNPEGFTSGEPEAAPWTYVKTFTEEGEYNYRCVVHSQVMTGKIIVADPLDASQAEVNQINIYPNPTENFIYISGASERDDNIRLAIFDITGKKVMEDPLIGRKRVNLSELKSGIYLYNLFADNELIQTGKVAKN